jgi:hypothetical protein
MAARGQPLRGGHRVTTPGFALEFDEPFAGDRLDAHRWLPYYLPHWSSWELAAARYTVADGRLQLLIEEDQPPWCPELDGALRVSSLQTALVAGEPGSLHGQHQFDPPATVRNGPHDLRLYTPRYGRFDVRATASTDPRLMFALWMIGLGDVPEHSAEICVVEIFGKDVGPDGAGVGVGVHPHRDPAVGDDFERVMLPIDVEEFHEYAAEWTPERIAFFVDGQCVKVVEQAIAYPMQLMLGLYEFPAEPGSDSCAGAYPKQVAVDFVRGYRFLDEAR